MINRSLAWSSMMTNPDARDFLVISMGCGNTAAAFAKFPIQKLDIVDLSPGAFAAANYFATNDGVVSDPRVRTVIEDGRNYLLRSQRKYDIISLELPSIHTEGVVFLYTREFYKIARQRLNEGGVLSQWIDAYQAGSEVSRMLVNTMLTEFPESVVWNAGYIWWVNGVKPAPDRGDPLQLDRAAIQARFGAPEVAKDLERTGMKVSQLLSFIEAGGDDLAAAVQGAYVLRDDRTLVDFLVPKLRRPWAFGGGLAYNTSPVRDTFQRLWEEDAAVDFDSAAPVLFPEAWSRQRRRKASRESIGRILASFPEEMVQAIWRTAWRRRMSGE